MYIVGTIWMGKFRSNVIIELVELSLNLKSVPESI